MTGPARPVLRTGLVGCGSIADELEDVLRDVPGWLPFPYSHATALRAHERTELVAAADPDAERLARFCDRWDVAGRHDGIEALLEAEDLDLVVVASPTWHHPEAFERAAAAGVRGVLLEKPVARTLRQADAMVAAANRHGTAAVVNHFRSFDPTYRTAARMVAEGRIGEVTGVVAIWGEGVSQGGCHLFDLLRVLVGRPVEWVFARLDDDPDLVDPGGELLLSLAGGVAVHVHMPWRVGAPPQLDVVGTEGRIHLSTHDRELVRFERRNDRPVPCREPFPSRAAHRSGMLVALDELVAQVEEGTRPSSGLPEGRAALEVSASVLASGRARRPVDLPFDDLDAVVEAWL